ncbi:MAG TPA: T9SS type A sorting domain-containing protein [Bacteroidota bacterium]|nr:T9SS type A sorting domain-containing protein [Bacteroidota bacterium]
MRNILLAAACLASIGTGGWGQTQVFLDDFGRSSLTTGAPTTYSTTVTAGDGGASIVSNSFLSLTNDATAAANANGITYVSGLTTDFLAPFSTTLNANPGVVEWTFNFRYNRTTNPAGFTAGNYGTAIILASSSASFHDAGNGYAIAYGNASTPDPIRLVRFTGGLTGVVTSIISSGTDDIAAVNNYVSVRVTYDPVGDTWTLYLRDDGASAWTDPSSGVVTQKGSTTSDNTYTATSLTNFGFYWSYATAANQTSQFDNFRVAVATGATPTIIVSASSLSSFGMVQVGSTSSEQSYTVSGSNLTNDITMTAPAGFEISTTSGSGFGNLIVLPQSGGTVPGTTIYVRFVPAAAVAYAGSIVHTSTGATTQNVTVSGTGVEPIPFQVVVHETMGAVSSTTTIAAHAGVNGFDNDNLSFSGSADLRATTASSGYSGASGGANVFFTTTVGTSFQIAGINTTGLNDLLLSFGIFKSATASDGSDFLVEVSSDGVTYNSLSFSALPTGAGTATWHYRTASGSIPAVENLHIRFRQNGTASQYRLDDVLLRNDAAAPTITADGTTTLCEGQSVTLTSSAAAAYLWSTSATTQSINVSSAASYTVTVTDAKGNMATSNPLEVTVIPAVAVAGVISGPGTVSPGQTGVAYSIVAVSGATQYTWTVPSDASISSGQGTTSITIDWGSTSGDVTVTPSNNCFNGASSSLAVTVAQLVGSVSGTVSLSTGGGMPNVTVKLLDGNGASLQNFLAVLTDAMGQYAFTNVPSGADYQVMIIEPLGYAVDANPKAVSLPPGGTATVDFLLTRSVITNRARGAGYWKHQFDEHRCRRHRWDETLAQLNAYIAAVHQYYTPHFDIFEELLTIEDWDDVLSLRRHPTMLDRARKQLAALVMNFVSLKIGQYTIVSRDDRTAGDVLTYVSLLVADGNPANDGLARELAMKVNNRTKIGAGIIPPGAILYKDARGTIAWTFGIPSEFALFQNYPNPFNPTTTISYDIPEDGRVLLNVYNALGQEVARLVDEVMHAGRYYVEWNAGTMSSGMYIYKLTTGSFSQSRKMVLLK